MKISAMNNRLYGEWMMIHAAQTIFIEGLAADCEHYFRPLLHKRWANDENLKTQVAFLTYFCLLSYFYSNFKKKFWQLTPKMVQT